MAEEKSKSMEITSKSGKTASGTLRSYSMVQYDQYNDVMGTAFIHFMATMLQVLTIVSQASTVYLQANDQVVKLAVFTLSPFLSLISLRHAKA